MSSLRFRLVACVVGLAVLVAGVAVPAAPAAADPPTGDLGTVPCIPLSPVTTPATPTGTPQYEIVASAPGQPDTESGPFLVGRPGTITMPGTTGAPIAVTWSGLPSLTPAGGISGQLSISAPSQPTGKVVVYVSIDGHQTYGFGVDGTPSRSGQSARLPASSVLSVTARSADSLAVDVSLYQGASSSSTVAIEGAAYADCRQGLVRASLRLSDPVPWSGLQIPGVPVGSGGPSIHLGYQSGIGPDGQLRRHVEVGTASRTDIVAAALINERGTDGALTAVDRAQVEIPGLPGPMNFDMVGSSAATFDSPAGPLPSVIGRFARNSGTDAVLPAAPGGGVDAVIADLTERSDRFSFRLGGLQHADVDVNPPPANAVHPVIVRCPTSAPDAQPGAPAVAVPAGCSVPGANRGEGEPSIVAPQQAVPANGACPPVPAPPTPLGFHVHFVHNEGPLHVLLRSPGRRVDAQIDNLPGTLTLDLSLSAAGVAAHYEASSEITRLTIDTAGSAPFAGRATFGHMLIEGIPGNITFSAATPGEQGDPCIRVGRAPPQRRAAELTVVGGVIRHVDVTLSDLAPNQVAHLLDDADGLVVQDTADAFVVRARIHQLHRIGLVSGDCDQPTDQLVASPVVTVQLKCATNRVDLDAASNQHVRVAIDAYDREKRDNALTVAELAHLSPNMTIEVVEKQLLTNMGIPFGLQATGPVQTEMHYHADQDITGPTSADQWALTFSTDMGRDGSLNARARAIPHQIDVCAVGGGGCVGDGSQGLRAVNLFDPSKFSLRFHSSSPLALDVSKTSAGDDYVDVEGLTFQDVVVAAGDHHVYVDTPGRGIDGTIHVVSGGLPIDAVLPHGFGADQYLMQWELPEIGFGDIVGAVFLSAVAWAPFFIGRTQVNINGALHCPPGTVLGAVGFNLARPPLCTTTVPLTPDETTTTVAPPSTTTTTSAPPPSTTTSTTTSSGVTLPTIVTTTTVPLRVTDLHFDPQGSRQPSVNGSTCRATAAVAFSTNGQAGTVQVRYEWYSYSTQNHSTFTTGTHVETVAVSAGQTSYRSSDAFQFPSDYPYAHGVRVSTTPSWPGGSIASENSSDLCAPG